MLPSGSSQNKDDANGLPSTNSKDQVQSLKVRSDESSPTPDRNRPNGQAYNGSKIPISPDHLPPHLEEKPNSEGKSGKLKITQTNLSLCYAH